jgi:tripartite-type tricarboxylate transporter receptor subunit TctC
MVFQNLNLAAKADHTSLLTPTALVIELKIAAGCVRFAKEHGMPNIRLSSHFKAGFLLAFMGLFNSGNAFSEPVAEFYAGKTITLLISSAPGGGYDGYARLLARHMGRHIPGNPIIVPKNMPGAGGLTLANYLYNRGPKDGSEMATVQNGLPFEKVFQMLSPEGQNALYDSTKFGWIGSITQTVFVTVTWHNAPVKTLAEAMSKESTLGASTTSSDSHVLAVLSNNLLGTKFKIVHGYDGSAAVDLAVERGEVDGEAGKDWTTILSSRPQWITEKKINILLQMGMKPHPDLVGVPMAIDLAKTPEDRRIMEMIFAKYGMARPIMVAPGVPPERLEALRQAFRDTMKDPEFLAEAQKLNMEISPVSGQDVEALVTKIMTTPADLAARARAALTPR